MPFLNSSWNEYRVSLAMIFARCMLNALVSGFSMRLMSGLSRLWSEVAKNFVPQR